MLFEKEYCELKQYKEGYLEDKVTYKYTLSTSAFIQLVAFDKATQFSHS